MRAPKAEARGAIWLVFALALVGFLGVFPYIGRLNNPNENVRTYMTMAMVENRTFRIDEIVARHGWTNDMAKAPDKKTGEPHLYSVKAPAVSYAGVPFYWAFSKIAVRKNHPVPNGYSTLEEREWWMRSTTLVLRVFAIQIPCFLFLVWFERWLRGVTSDVVLRLCAVVAAGLGTNYLGYSLMFASHAPFACAAFASFAITTRERQLFPHDVKRRRLSRAFLAGFFAGLATLLEYHAFPVSGALALYALCAFWRPTRLLAFGIGGAINAAALMYFQWRAFGSPFTPGHRMSENPAFAALLNKGLFGIGKPNGQVAIDISLSKAFGFFGTSPFMWLGLLAIPAVILFARGAKVERRQLRVATFAWCLTMVLLWLTVSAAINWRGGWTIGPRYLGAAPPFFAYGAVVALDRFGRASATRRTLARALAGGLAIASVIQSGVVGLHFNSIPESVTRPLAQFTLPLARAGFVPHHVGEAFGFVSPRGWWAIAIGIVLAAVVAALSRTRWRGVAGERWPHYAVRVALVVAIAAIGLRGAFSKPTVEEEGDEGLDARRYFAREWEPTGRDWVATFRVEAERAHGKKPCLWYKVADLERMVGMEPEAARDEKLANVPRGSCPP